jgi:hypothetical protein
VPGRNACRRVGWLKPTNEERETGSIKGAVMAHTNRRDFLRAATASMTLGLGSEAGFPLEFCRTTVAQEPGLRPPAPPAGLAVLNPCDRVPVSLIIDDSTCLVNLAHFGIPQFQEVFPDQYRQPWKTLPREIPDAFVRKFGEWCADRGVKGKYSVVPYPACVGWLDRELPGWSRAELEASLGLVRKLIMPNCDIHPEMISHTWVIDTKRGRPYPERSADFMENWGWSAGKSADELADYMSYALRILKNVGLTCEGITTPGGFGTRALPELAQGVLEAARDIFSAEIPHYFRHLFTDARSVAPRVEYASGINGPDPKCVVSIIGCTGDWFGGWDGLKPGSADAFITPDRKHGRLPSVIGRGEPAILVSHWPGMYFNGRETGFQILREVVTRLEDGFDNLMWMKLSEIARYWAARELTKLERPSPDQIALFAPFPSRNFTLKIEPDSEKRLAPVNRIELKFAGSSARLADVSNRRQLKSGTKYCDGASIVACFDLPKGPSRLVFS